MNDDTKEVIELKTEEIQKKLKDLLNLSEIEELLKSSEMNFEYEGVKYRIKKPTFQQKQDAYKKRVEKFTELLQNDKYLLENDLKATYLKRGIDVEDLSKQMMNKMKRRDDLMIKLGESIKNGSADTELQGYKKEIESINIDIQNISIKRTQYLEFSIENQVLIYTYSYFTFILSEKYDETTSTWIRVWNKWEDFDNSEEKIVAKCSYYTTLLVGHEEI